MASRGEETRMDKHEERAADAIGPSLEPGGSTFGTFDDDRHYHDGHQDTYLVEKDESGEVTAEQYHILDDGTAMEDQDDDDDGDDGD
jgi:hypothetical protein